MLLKHLQNVSPFRGMPVDDKGSSSSITTVTGETVQLYYNSSGTLTSDAGEAAGTIVVGQLAYDNIKNILGSMEAIKGDTSLSFTSTALTTEVLFDFTQFEYLDETSIFNKMAAIGAALSNGQYVVDYASGTIYGKKTTTASTLTSTTYKYKSSATSSSGGGTAVTSVVPGTGATNLGKAEDAAHTSGDVGVMFLAKRTDTAASSSSTDGDYVTVNSDSLGHIWGREGYVDQLVDNTNGVGQMVVKPIAVSTYSWTQFQNLGANATLNVKATPGNVKSVYCHNVSGGDRYFQLHNTATTPGGGAVPARTYFVPAGGVLELTGSYFGEQGINFSTGIAFAFSTTEATYTAATATDHITEINYK